MKNRLMSSLLSGVLALALPAVALAGPQHRDQRPDAVDFARVTHVEPIYKTITYQVPERSCWTETHYRREHKSHTPTLIGTLIGGAIGNELGHNKSNKRVGTVVGAVLGASIARDLSQHHKSHNRRVYPVSEEVCEINERIEHEEKIVGYNVSYRYQGHTYHTRMNHHPGKRIKVAVQVTPVH